MRQKDERQADKQQGVVAVAATHRVALIWAGAIATITLSGVTGLALESRWSYVTLGGAFVALLAVVAGVSVPQPHAAATPDLSQH